MKAPTRRARWTPNSRAAAAVEVLAEMCDSEALKADGFDEACVGVASVFSEHGRRAILAYDIDRMARILVRRDGMTEEGAREYLEFNVLGAYLGKGTPVFIEYADAVRFGGK